MFTFGVAPASTPSSPQEMASAVDAACRARGGIYSQYSCKQVSWDDVARGTVGGQLSALGANITDTRLFSKDKTALFTVRPQNLNERLGYVASNELAVIAGNHTPGGGDLSAVTLRTFLERIGTYGSYAGVPSSTNLASSALDTKVSVRFQTVFLPVKDEALGAMEFASEMYNYQTTESSDPKNLLLLCTSQGTAVQASSQGSQKLFHHAVQPDGTAQQYYLEAERSRHKVGGAQMETDEEAAAAAARGKAVSSVIGIKALATRFNVLMTIQVPLKQVRPHVTRGFAAASVLSCGVGGGSSFGGYGSAGAGAGGFAFATKSMAKGMPMAAFCAPACSPMPQSKMMSASFSPSMAYDMSFAPECASRSRSIVAPRAPPTGTANAARVSRGSSAGVFKPIPFESRSVERDPAEHVTATIVLYYTVAGGVPSEADVVSAIDDMEALLATCTGQGRLADATFNFMKGELTVAQLAGIKGKVETQPYVPPVGAKGIVSNRSVFPE